MNELECFFANASDRSQIEDLRMREYARAGGFALDLETLRWKESDDESFVMVARRGDKFVSTMRGEVIEDLNVLEQKLECPWTFPLELNMPVLLLSRAATSSEERTSGLNLALRYHFLRFARARGIRFVVGTFVTGSPRENSLRAMGYQFFVNELGWQQSTYRSLREVQVVILDLEKSGDRALQFCVERAGGAIEQFQFLNEFPNLKIVRKL